MESAEASRRLSSSLSKANIINLHIFPDGSEIRYASVTYLTLSWVNDTANCGLLIGKFSVTSRKMVSIPRLELISALLSVKFMNLILGKLGVRVDRTLLWTD